MIINKAMTIAGRREDDGLDGYFASLIVLLVLSFSQTLYVVIVHSMTGMCKSNECTLRIHGLAINNSGIHHAVHVHIHACRSDDVVNGCVASLVCTP